MEGPSLVILREELKPFVGRTIVEVSGSAKQVDLTALSGQSLRLIKTWGKHLLLKVGPTTLRIHFLLWGSYTIDQRKDRNATMTMRFADREVNFYSSAIKSIEHPLKELYDWRVDVMSPKWDAAHVRTLVKAQPEAFVTDVLLEQDIFAGVGNIIKNEVFFTRKIYPETKVKALTARQLTALIDEAWRYSHQFYRWKKQFILKRYWRIYRKRTRVECDRALTIKHMGKKERYTYYCPQCQRRTSQRATRPT